MAWNELSNDAKIHVIGSMNILNVSIPQKYPADDEISQILRSTQLEWVMYHRNQSAIYQPLRRVIQKVCLL